MAHQISEDFINKWVDNSNPEQPSLKMCFMNIKHIDCYDVNFTNQGFDTNAFGTEKRFQGYVQSPDVWYYDAQITLGPRLSYACGYLIKDFVDSEALAQIDETLGDFFQAILAKDVEKASELAKRYHIETREDGVVSLGGYEHFDVLFDLSLTPKA